MEAIPTTESLETVSVILPVVTETKSLLETVEILLQECGDNICELIVVVCDRTRKESLEVAEELRSRHSELITILHQELPFLGGAMRDAFAIVRGSHLIMMSSDLETDPRSVADMIMEAAKLPGGIVTATRWRRGGGFKGYNKVKLVANWIFNRFFSLLYWTPLTDLTFGYRLFPTRLVQAIDWQELRHPFVFETILIPLRLGIPVVEISSPWKARAEGESQNAFMRNFAYVRTGLRVRFTPVTKLLRS